MGIEVNMILIFFWTAQHSSLLSENIVFKINFYNKKQNYSFSGTTFFANKAKYLEEYDLSKCDFTCGCSLADRPLQRVCEKNK